MRLGADILELDLYAVLGLGPHASWHEIRAAHRRHARRSHPDINPRDPEAGRRMALANMAARVLLDPGLRAAYDRVRLKAAPAPIGAAPSPRQAWYERAESSDDEWVRPAPRARREAGTFPGFSEHLRHGGARLSLRVQDWLLALPLEQRMALTALSIALAAGLLSLARPSNAFWLDQTVADAQHER